MAVCKSQYGQKAQAGAAVSEAKLEHGERKTTGWSRMVGEEEGRGLVAGGKGL